MSKGEHDTAIAAGVSALNACISDAPRILPDEEIVERIVRAVLHERWRPIDSEPKDGTPRLVTTDPTDPECAYLVALTEEGEHFNGEVVIENMIRDKPTHWHPIPVDPVST